MNNFLDTYFNIDKSTNNVDFKGINFLNKTKSILESKSESKNKIKRYNIANAKITRHSHIGQ